MIFVDTNVLVYSTVRECERYREARDFLDARVTSGVPLFVSSQVLREFLAVMSRPQLFSQASSLDSLTERVAEYESIFRVLDDDEVVRRELTVLLRRVPVGGKQVHDANIVATMLANGLTKLATFNRKDFVRFAPPIELIPVAP